MLKCIDRHCMLSCIDDHGDRFVQQSVDMWWSLRLISLAFSWYVMSSQSQSCKMWIWWNASAAVGKCHTCIDVQLLMYTCSHLCVCVMLRCRRINIAAMLCKKYIRNCRRGYLHYCRCFALQVMLSDRLSHAFWLTLMSHLMDLTT